MRHGRILHGVEHQHIGDGTDQRDQGREAPLRAPQAARSGQVAQHHGSEEEYAHEVAHVVDEDGRHQQHLHAVAVHHGVAGDEGARQQAIPQAQPQPLARFGVMARAQQAGAARDQEHANHHAGNAQHTQRGNLLPQEDHRHHGRQQRPRAARQRIDHGEVRAAVAAQQGHVVGHVQQAAGQHHQPFVAAPCGHHIAPHPPAQRRPDHHHDDRGEEGEARVAARLLGHDVPAGMDEAGNDDQGKGLQRHGQVRGKRGVARERKKAAHCAAWGLV